MSLVFIGIIYITRDPLAPTDAHNYIAAIEGSYAYDKSASIVFASIGEFLRNLGLDTFLVLNLQALILMLSCLFISYINASPYPLLFLISSESFVLMSFNAMRQGMALGFMIMALGVIIKFIIKSKNRKLTEGMMFILSFFLLILSFSCHGTTLIYSLIIAGIYVIKLIFRVFDKLRIGRINLTILIIAVIATLSASANIISMGLAYINRLGSLLSTVYEVNSYESSFYRIGIMILLSYLSLTRYEVRTENTGYIARLKELLIILNISFIPIIAIGFLTNALFLSRFTHLTILPILVSILLACETNKRPYKLQLILFSIIGIITYTSASIYNNIY
ncbi:EpsG family protein [Prochlorococcus sp. MIT 1307]|uniref:EpsG family protein n=1 Tax=Prochlorococcus sp. MIT 1307 TaxID=3096219 RepID=UPI002A764C43|nr:EpsG family protein [Prochlorococcus sp. MIT 1307]